MYKANTVDLRLDKFLNDRYIQKGKKVPIRLIKCLIEALQCTFVISISKDCINDNNVYYSINILYRYLDLFFPLCKFNYDRDCNGILYDISIYGKSILVIHKWGYLSTSPSSAFRCNKEKFLIMHDSDVLELSSLYSFSKKATKIPIRKLKDLAYHYYFQKKIKLVNI